MTIGTIWPAYSGTTLNIDCGRITHIPLPKLGGLIAMEIDLQSISAI
jgi:hypothetical protein